MTTTGRRRRRRPQAQPYRRGKVRRNGRALMAMMRGRTATGYNPQDIKRAAQKQARRRRRR